MGTGRAEHKSLRAERMADCIFSGTAKRPPLGMAEVIITLEDTELAEAGRFILTGWRSGRGWSRPLAARSMSLGQWPSARRARSWRTTQRGSAEDDPAQEDEAGANAESQGPAAAIQMESNVSEITSEPAGEQDGKKPGRKSARQSLR